MSDDTTMPENSDGEQDAAPEAPQQPRESDGLGDAGKQAIDRMKAERNRAQSELKAMQREIEKLRQAQMTEQERAVAEAEKRGRQSALGEVGTRLARVRFDALAARRNPDYDTSGLDFIDLKRFVADDGELDEKALAAAVERLVPAAQTGPPSFDGGARKTASPTASMDALIRRQAARR